VSAPCLEVGGGRHVWTLPVAPHEGHVSTSLDLDVAAVVTCRPPPPLDADLQISFFPTLKGILRPTVREDRL
jgi:hypothetical protein